MKIGILISGRGSNMAAIADAIADKTISNAEIAIVVSDKADARGIIEAQKRGLETAVIERNGRKRAEHDAEIIAKLKECGVELVCLAGYMRLLSSGFVAAFPEKIVNIHPSLLPSFPGLDAQAQAVDYGAKVSGCTVHFVDELLDHGAIILQQTVEVDDDETADTLSAKILQHEHRTYIEAIRRITSGEIEIKGRRVVKKS